MEKVREYIQEKLNLAYSKQKSYIDKLNCDKKKLEEITPNDDVLKEIIDVDMAYCQYHIDLFQKDLDKYTEMYFEVNKTD